MINVNFQNLPKVTNDVFYPYYWDRHRYLLLYGGAGSGKSVFAAMKLIYRIVSEGFGNRFLVVRKVSRTIRQSCFALIRGLITQYGMDSLFRINKTDMEIECINGSTIIFVGIDDEEKVKSIYDITSIWIEEPTELSESEFTQLDLRLRTICKSYKQIMLTFNPISMAHWLKIKFFDSCVEGSKILKTTYKHNKFLSPEYKTVLEALEAQNKNLYRVYALGEWGILKGLIFENVEILDSYKRFDFSNSDCIYGLDFGYNNPMALVKCNIVDGDTVFLTESFYASKETTEDLIAWMGKHLVSKTTPIYCDAAEPDRIETIRRAGYNAFPARKGKGSVNARIDFCKSLHLKSCQSNPNINKEFGSYVWKMDANDMPLDEPVKMNDHAMDAFSGAVWTHCCKVQPEVEEFSMAGFGR